MTILLVSNTGEETLSYFAIPVPELRAWLDLVLFTMIPGGIREFFHWLYQWQALAAAILVLLAAYILSRAVLKAARTQPANQVETARPAAFRALSEPVKANSADETKERTIALPPFQKSLTTLRGQIRVMLGRFPCSDEPLSAENSQLCKQIAKFLQVEAIRNKAQDSQGDLEALRVALAKLGSATTNRSAWGALVQTNEVARDLLQVDERSDDVDADWERFTRLWHNRLEG